MLCIHHFDISLLISFLAVLLYTYIKEEIPRKSIRMNFTTAAHHWPWINYMYASTRCLGAFLSLFGNSLTLYIIWKYEEIRTTSNYLIASLAVADLFGGLTGTLTPLLLQYLHTKSGKWLTVCYVHETVFHLSSLMNVCTICLISVDRFIYIHSPFKYHSLLTKKRVVISISIIWLYVLFLVIFIVMSFGSYLDEYKYCYIVLAMPELYNRIMTLHFVVASIATVLLYSKIALTAFRQSRAIHVQGIGNLQTSSVQMKITKLMLMVVGLYFALYLPSVVVGYFLNDLNTEAGIFLVHLIFILEHVNTWINPVVYGFKNIEIRRAYTKTLMCR